MFTFLAVTPTPIPDDSNPFVEVINDVYDLYLKPFYDFLQTILNLIPFYFWLPIFVLAIGSITILVINRIHSSGE